MTDATLKSLAPAAAAGPRQDRAEHIGLKETLWLMARALAYIWPMRGRFVVGLVLASIAVVASVVAPWPLKILTDYVVLRKPVTPAEVAEFPPFLQPFMEMMIGWSPQQVAFATVLLAAGFLLTFGVFGQGAAGRDSTDAQLAEGQDTATRTENEANRGRSYASGIWGFLEYRWELRFSQALNHYYRCQLFERIKALPMTTLEDRRIGDSLYRVMYDTPMISAVCQTLIQQPITTVLTIAALGYVLTFSFGDAPEVVWAALAVAPAAFLLTLPLAGFARRRSTQSRLAGGDTTSAIEEGMSNILAIQSLGGWKRERTRFAAASAESFRRFRGVVLANILVLVASGLAQQLLLSAVFLVVSAQIIAGEMSVGDYMVITIYFASMAGSAILTGRLWVDLQDNAAGLKRVFELMDMPVEQDLGASVLPPIRQGVKMEAVTLVYPDGRKALDAVNFEARVGEIVAIVGPTGAGKTSLAYLIPRFHRPTSGKVTIDGYDLDGVKLESLRSQVTYVFQETHLFGDTIAANIAYAKPHASREEIERVAKVAGAHDFIMALPEGYDTDLGAKGGKLSVGQKQRVAIARGLLRESKILVLDEPTSALDPETERYLVAALEEASKDRAVIIIAHRLSTIVHADRIVFLEDGKVREEGSHAELMARGGAYAEFARLQSR
ncbi:ABC transporter ATP-binding protein [Phenylobacterium sp.]|jgi:ABC-type multidrug transport system fused ATPase/permease subunit|uniref:ABC transporter ATP-binding protein n=1 Tax=Phenylobacterium sp. TaxID=1871053 RepID=UPI002E333C30|nr:ABC transporter ATP-binding protein [Phenylobacterium sp.]HEX2561193.1 ABC transporter ATP-binding protein [Phenylobacterium sp.]